MHFLNLLEVVEYLNSHKMDSYIDNFLRVFDGEIERKFYTSKLGFLPSKVWREKNTFLIELKKKNFEEFPERLKYLCLNQQVRRFNSNFYGFNRYTTGEKSSLHNWRGAWAPFRSAQFLSAMNIFECQIFPKQLFLKLKKILLDETELSYNFSYNMN